MQTKSPQGDNFTLIKMTITGSKQQKIKVSKDVLKLEPLCFASMDVKWYIEWQFLPKLSNRMPYDLAIPLLNLCLKEEKIGT